MKNYLNTTEAADYLGIKERKLYELVANGAVPCSKATGKWLFPRAALDRWIEAGLARPQGFAPADPPPIIGGSNDPLLEWAARRSSCGLALLSIGSEAGLAKLAANEVAIAAIHLHGDAEPDEDSNLAAVAALPSLWDAVVIAFARREQGLLLPQGNPKGHAALGDAIRSGARIGRRQAGAGAELLLQKLLRADGIDPSGIAAAGPYATGDDLAFAIAKGEVDCGIATRAVAAARGLDFLPLAWERFDLAMRRRTYFAPGPQAFLAIMRSGEFRKHAEALGGLDVSDGARSACPDDASAHRPRRPSDGGACRAPSGCSPPAAPARSARLVAAEDLEAPAAFPRTAVALRSGFAVNALDCAGASPQAPAPLPGMPVQVVAGDALPPGCDAILDPAALHTGRFGTEALEPVEPGAGVRRSGEDLAAGGRILSDGQRIAAERILAAEIAGCASVAVRRPAVRLDWQGGPNGSGSH